MLKQRIISGLILAFTLTALIFSIGDVYLSYFVGIIASVSLWEYLKVRFSNLITLTILVAFVFCMYLSNILFFNILFLILGAITILISAFLIISFPLNKNFLRNPIFWVLSGLTLHLAFFASIFYLLFHGENILDGYTFNKRALIIFIILISVLMDSIAYFAGKKFGKRPFMSNVSPNKTLEGFASAILISPLLLSLAANNFFNISFSLALLILLCVSFLSVLGDAHASMIKRVVEIKDFSNLIPGHGGLYDRLDSHIVVFPSFVFMLYLI